MGASEDVLSSRLLIAHHGDLSTTASHDAYLAESTAGPMLYVALLKTRRRASSAILRMCEMQLCARNYLLRSIPALIIAEYTAFPSRPSTNA